MNKICRKLIVPEAGFTVLFFLKNMLEIFYNKLFFF